MLWKRCPCVVQRSVRKFCRAAFAINDPKALQELQHEFGRYEEALCQNNVKELDLLFHKSPETVRYGVSENLYGYEAIQAFRGARAPPGQREILRSALTTYGSDLGVTHIEFQRDGSRRVGRQTQTWLRTAEGWKVISAHVSMMEEAT
ncbi:unnamed protein product [Durusdinium trenchii]|uniref:Uncharacterized protein n=2 Tax=Durusdinium trenchii TaxID=1381693 RepID=A0ABP0N801_9DINO